MINDFSCVVRFWNNNLQLNYIEHRHFNTSLKMNARKKNRKFNGRRCSEWLKYRYYYNTFGFDIVGLGAGNFKLVVARTDDLFPHVS